MHLTRHIGQTEIPARVAVGELDVIEAQQMQNSGVQIVRGHRVLDGVAAEPSLNQPDGIHPNAQGVDLIVGKILPKAEELVNLARK
mgnify:CR=1 FL=1